MEEDADEYEAVDDEPAAPDAEAAY
jgi:hypothetical protein